jgi:branched-chain amino acid transport system substrate-binding protein
VCAETAASPISGTNQPMRDFLAAYRAAYSSEPDAYAAAQFDAVHMLGHVLGEITLAKKPLSPAAVQARLASEEWTGVVTTYKSDGKGNMAHDAEIVCYNGASRVPTLAARYTLK